LVENCFVHSVEKSLDPVNIEVQVTQVENDITISVSDNGPGLTPERQAEITGILETDTYEYGSGGGGVGLSNIHHRLRYAFGPAYGIKFMPLPKGLAVFLKFPRIDKGSRK
jgi:two-component system sensor histidine kinase YesM